MRLISWISPKYHELVGFEKLVKQSLRTSDIGDSQTGLCNTMHFVFKKLPWRNLKASAEATWHGDNSAQLEPGTWRYGW